MKLVHLILLHFHCQILYLKKFKKKHRLCKYIVETQIDKLGMHKSYNILEHLNL